MQKIEPPGPVVMTLVLAYIVTSQLGAHILGTYVYIYE